MIKALSISLAITLPILAVVAVLGIVALFAGLLVWLATTLLYSVFGLEILNITFFESVLVGIALSFIGSFFRGTNG